jgi:effector-binding domain-containing protein
MCELVSLEPLSLGGLRQVVPFETRADHIPPLFDEMVGKYKAAGIMVAGPEIALYRMISAEEIEVTIGIVMQDLLPGFDRFETPATRALRTHHTGAFNTLKDVYPVLHAAAAEQGLKPTGLAREVYRIIAHNADHNLCDVYLDVE